MTRLPIPLSSLSKILKTVAVAADQAGSGGNSRVYRVHCQDGRDYAVKFYCQRTVAGRDRLEVEFEGLAFMWESGLRCIPRPLTADRAGQVAVYEFVNGQQIDCRSVTAEDVEQVVRFAAELKGLSRSPSSNELPSASDACFSVDSAITDIESRLCRLTGLQERGTAYGALSQFLSADFAVALDVLRKWVTATLGREACARELPPDARTLSPSDFGFHNALRRPSGELAFFDFEYFGWDDPAKMIADFVLHPAMDLSDAIKHLFVQRMLDCFATDSSLARRLKSLYPFLGLKWCTIMLNEFIPGDLARREFAARSPLDIKTTQMRQLEKSRTMLRKIMGEFPDFPYTAQAA